MKGWISSSLQDACEMYQPETITAKEMVPDGAYPVYGANGVIGRYDRFNHEGPQLLVTCRGATCGSVNVSQGRAWITGNSMVIRPRTDSIDLRFLEYLFRGGIDLRRAITGAAQPQITRANLNPITFTYPGDVSEQRHIVAILDEAFEAIATAKANTEKNLQNARELFANHIEQVLARRQSDWLDCKLGDLCQVKTGKKDVNQGNPKGQYPFFTCAVQHTYSDSFSFDTEALLIAGNGNVGHVTYYTGKFEAYQRTYVLSSFKDVDARYLFRVLDKRLSATVSKQKLGNTMPYIKVGMLTDFVVPVPSQAEQRRITEELETVGGETERLESLYVAKSAALIELKKSLLDQAFTGQLTAKTTDKQLAEVA